MTEIKIVILIVAGIFVGSIIGALIASYLAVKKGAGFIRAVILLSVILTILQISGLVNFTAFFKKII